MEATKTLKLRIKDKHAAVLSAMARVADAALSAMRLEKSEACKARRAAGNRPGSLL